MFNPKYERYWDNLDIDDEWRKILDSEYEKSKSDNNEHYRNTRSFDKMGEELVYQLSTRESVQDENDGVSSDKPELIKGIPVTEFRSALDSLSKRQRWAVELYFFRGYNQEQVAEFMGCTQPNVSYIISQTIEKLTKLFK